MVSLIRCDIGHWIFLYIHFTALNTVGHLRGKLDKLIIRKSAV